MKQLFSNIKNFVCKTATSIKDFCVKSSNFIKANPAWMMVGLLVIVIIFFSIAISKCK